MSQQDVFLQRGLFLYEETAVEISHYSFYLLAPVKGLVDH